MTYGLPIETANVRTIDAYSGDFDDYERKAMLSMQTMAALVDGDQASFDELNPQLQVAAEEIGAPASATYEDLIFSNPVFGTVKVLSQSAEPAGHEARFYRAHRIIETDLHLAIRKLMSHGDNAGRLAEMVGLQIEPFPYSEQDTQPFQHVAVAVEGLKGLRQGIKDKETFNAFRFYFAEELNGNAGPSGLYSATMPIFDLIVAGGQNIPVSIHDFMTDALKRGLYPQRIGYDTLISHLLESDTPCMDMPDHERQAIIGELNRFRKAHKATVKRLVPKVHDGELPGSGGIENYQELHNAKIIRPVNTEVTDD